MVLQDCFLSQLNSVLLFHFPDHVLQELQLIFLFDDLGIDFDLDLLLDALLVILVAGHLREDLQALQHSSSEALLVELVTEILHALEPLVFLGLLLKVPQQELLSSRLRPHINQVGNDLFVSIILSVKLLALEIELHVVFVQLLQLLAFL